MGNGIENTKTKDESKVVGEVKQGVSLKDLLQVLRESGVKRFKDNAIEIEFDERAYLKNPIVDNDEDETINEKVKQLKNMSDEELLYYSAKG